MVTFAQPFWIVAGAAVVSLYWILSYRIDLSKNNRLKSFVSSSLIRDLTSNISTTRRKTKKALLLLTIFCCFLALARPQYGERWIDVKHKGIDILFALDTSKSMLAEDIQPNRLERSKFAVMDFVSQLTGDRVGLMPFSGASYLVCPLTSDYQAFEQSLMAVNTAIIPVGGTDIGNALQSAEKVLNNEANHKILIMITDGEDLEGQVAKAAKIAKKQNVTVYTVGIGTTGGELVPDKEKGGFIKDENGNYIKSKLDEKSLKTIADITGGIYVPLGNKGQGLETIYQEKLTLIPKTEFAEKRKKVPVERFSWPLSAAVFFLALEYMVSGRKSERILPKVLSRLHKNTISAKTLLIFLPLFSALMYVTDLSASSGEDSYRRGNYIEAAQYYQKLLEKDPNNPKLLYNSGTIAYKNNLIDEAISAFKKSLASDDIQLQQKSYYNLGNSFYRQGEQTLQTDPKKTIESWEQALTSYKSTLALDENNTNARFNLDLVTKKLEELKQKQNNQAEPESGQNNSEDQQENSDKKDNKNNSSENKNNTGENNKPAPANEGQQAQEEKEPAGDLNKQEKDNQKQTTSDNNQGADSTVPEPAGQNNNNFAQQDPASKNDPEKTPAMTKEEAEKLLKAVQDEEGRLNLYLPMQQKTTNSPPSKDW